MTSEGRSISFAKSASNSKGGPRSKGTPSPTLKPPDCAEPDCFAPIPMNRREQPNAFSLGFQASHDQRFDTRP